MLSFYHHLKKEMAIRHEVNWDDSLNIAISEFKKIDISEHSEILEYMKLANSRPFEDKSKTQQQLIKIVKLAKEGDQICQEFLALQYPIIKAQNDYQSGEEDVDTDINIIKPDDSESGEKEQYNPLDMAKQSVKDHKSALGYYVLFKHNVQKNRPGKAARCLTPAIESNNPVVRQNLFGWLIAYEAIKPKYRQKLEQHSPLFRALLYFFKNEKNPFASLNTLKKKLLTLYLETSDVENAWNELKTMRTMGIVEAPDLVLLVVLSREIFDLESKTTLLINMVSYKTQNAEFKEYIDNHPVLSHFVNEEYLEQHNALRRVEKIVLEDASSEKPIEDLQLIFKKPAITIVISLAMLSMDTELPEFKLINQFLNAEESGTLAKTFVKFNLAVGEEDFTKAAQYFMEIDKSLPIKAFMVLQILFRFNLTDELSYCGFPERLELKKHSAAFQQFADDYADYLSCLKQEKVLEDSDCNDEENRSFQL